MSRSLRFAGRGATAFAVTVALVAACSGGKEAPAVSTAAAPQSSASAMPAPRADTWPASLPDAWLVVGRAGSASLDVIKASTGENFMHLPPAIADDHWASVVSATTLTSTTLVKQIREDDQDGSTITVAGAWRLPTIGSDPGYVGLSADRSILALVAAAPSAETSRFAVVDLATAKTKVLELKGAFEFDAISPDGSVLYVVEHLDLAHDGKYQVRAVDVRNGLLKDGVIVDKSKPNEQMAGSPVEQLRLAHGLVLTLYRGTEHPFVHALDTVNGGAVCIDLPASRDDATDRSDDWGLAVAPNGSAVYAVNASLGVGAVIDPVKLQVRRTASFAPLAAAATLAKFGHGDMGITSRRVAVSPDGATVYAAGRRGVLALAASDLSVLGSLLDGTRVDALGVTLDGAGLFALRHADGRIVRVDLATGQVVAEVAGAGFDRLLAVARW
jgi:DNA-binding beta-propeller fold protein YncE